MVDSMEVNLTIGGVKVSFPFKPYPSQLSMMSMIIKGLHNRKHCLLESPTGSGKSLALLCSAIAWQNDLRERLHKELHDDEQTQCDSAACGQSPEDAKELAIAKQIPRIWFGTRTHKQIAQIAHELKRTAYKSVNMTILSSREHSCIHPFNKDAKNKTDGCLDLRKGTHKDQVGSKCVYYQNVHRMKSHEHLKCSGLTTAWDVEDLVQLGQKIKSCPYYSARELIDKASIIFCPYNYLIDSGIRDQMDINLANQIVILDEAHNIEDTARDAASFTMNEVDLANTVADLDHLIADDVRVENHKCLHLLCTRIGMWIQNKLSNLQEAGFETWSRVWVGTEFISDLEEWGITADTLPNLQKNFNDAIEKGEEEDPVVLHSASQSLLSSLFMIMRFLFVESHKFSDDYRISVIRTTQYGVPPPKRTRDGWISVNRGSSKYFCVNLHFWCLNPAVAFGYLSCSRTVILTSGTLSPMSSFSSELGLKFPIQLEAPHVIPDSQVWVGSVGSGPSGHALQATYQHTNSFEFQDELGKLLLAVCGIIPKGVLCFFSSYKIMDTLSERWKNTGVWGEMQKLKHVFVEPHGRNKSNFDEILQSFYTTVSSSEDMEGALLLAVCRGKISEGLDFSDDNARAVITVGIPYPNFKDKQVELKRQYNNVNSKSKGLLFGSEWYEIQAYRALNQALGRCIRHRNDWGALIIVDNRFCSNPKKYCKGLSKWVRQKVKCYSEFSMVTKSLVAFCQTQARRVPGSAISSILSSPTQCSYSSFIKEMNSAKSDHALTSTQAIFETSGKPSQTIPIHKFFSAYGRSDVKKVPSVSKPVVSLGHSNIESKCSEKVVVSDDDSRNKLAVPFTNAACIITNTPKKTNDVIVIPESPEIADDEDDFQSASLYGTSKLKSLSRKSRTSPTISGRLAKKCRTAICFDSCDSSDVTEQNTNEIVKFEEEQQSDSSRLPSLRTRKKKRTKVSSSQTHNRNEDDRGKIYITCTSCDCKLLTREKIPKKICNTFKYMQENFSNSEQLYLTDFDLQGSHLQQVKNNSCGLDLNAVWCSNENVVYSFYECMDCNVPVAFRIILPQSRSAELFLLPVVAW